MNETVSFCAVRTRCNGPFKTVDLLGEALKLANYLWLQCIASGADIGHMCTLTNDLIQFAKRKEKNEHIK